MAQGDCHRGLADSAMTEFSILATRGQEHFARRALPGAENCLQQLKISVLAQFTQIL